METGNDKFVKPVLLVNKMVIRFLVCIMTICLILASVQLLIGVVKKIMEPPFLLIDIPTLFDGFSLVLIIVIGYELVKSLLIIISSQTIPSFPIVQIAIIAVANKIITLDLKHTDPFVLMGLSALMTGLGLTYFFHKKKTDAVTNGD